MLGVTMLIAPAEPLRLEFDDVLAQRFVRRVRAYLNHPDDEPPLERLMDFFDLSKSELGRLFGVRRQAVDGWLANGVPAERQEKLGVMLALADLMALRPTRCAARRAAPGRGARGRQRESGRHGAQRSGQGTSCALRTAGTP
jgi:hypothetical protein